MIGCPVCGEAFPADKIDWHAAQHALNATELLRTPVAVPVTFVSERAMLVARGVDTSTVEHLGRSPEIIILHHWMKFRTVNDSEFTIYRDKAENLPAIEIGAVHWLRITEELLNG